MVKRLNFHFQYKPLTNGQKAVVLPVMIVIAAIAVGVGVWAVIVAPPAQNPENGVSANGFSASIEKGTDLGVGKIVSRNQVATALGNKAQKVTSSDVSSVFNYDGDRGQTATYNFVRADGLPSSLYIDLTIFKNQTTMDSENIYAGTELARIINGHSAYYMHAQTLGTLREYRLLVVNGLKAYKFVIDQPVNDIKIDEVAAVASLIKLAQVAKL